MPTPGNRKQRYVLDIDDVVRRGFMTQANAENLIAGLNESGSVEKLAVAVGGTNNDTFTDQELLRYDAATGKIVSAGVTGVLPGGASAFVPWETGALYSNSGLDTATKSSNEILLASQTFNLPANSLWSDLMMVYNSVLGPSGTTVTGLQMRFSGVATPPSTVIQMPATHVYQVGASPDTLALTWVAMGAIPSDRQTHSVLTVNLYGKPQDIPGLRALLTRVSYRGAVPAPTGGQKGIPIFFATPVIVYNTPAPIGWTTFDATAYVPEGASAVLLWAQLREEGTGSSVGTPSTINYRASAGAYIYSLGSCMANSGSDADTTVSQQMLPFSTSGLTRSFQYSVTNNPNMNATIILLGYIS